MFKFSPRCTLPGLTSPPTRIRVPTAICFSAMSVGELKNTIESLSELSTSAAAIASTPRLDPIRIRRRCLRVIRSCSSFESQTFDHVFDLAKLVVIARQRPPCLGGGGLRLVALAEHHRGAQQASPPVEVVAVLLETIGQARNHATDHLFLLIGVRLRRGGNVWRARTGRTGRRRCGACWRRGRGHFGAFGELAKLVRIAAKRAAGIRHGRLRLVVLTERPVGAYQLR